MELPNVNNLIATGYRAPDFFKGAREAQQLQLGQQQLDAYPKEQAWQEEQRGMARQKYEWLKEDQIREMEMRPLKDDIEKMKYLLSVGPMITFDKYKQSRDWLINKNKIPDFVLPEAQVFMDKAAEQGTDPAELFEKWKGATLISADDKLREKLGMARLESAEKLGALRAESAEKIAGARQAGMERNQDLRYQSQQDLENLRAQHRKELEEVKATSKEGKDLLSRQKEARLTVFKLYGMNEFSQYEETTSDKAGEAVSEASKMLEKDPDLDPMTAASKAKRRVDSKFKAIEGIQTPKKKKETVQGVRNSLDGGVDTADILKALLAKGWSRQDAIEVIRNAAGIQR